jgi:predicted ATP-dependent serine protease
MAEIIKEKVIEAVTKLTTNYNNLDEKIIIKVMALLKDAMPVSRLVQAVRADKIIIPPRKKSFIQFGEPWLDGWLDGGMRRKEVLLFGGVPFSGKTHLLAWAGSRFVKQNLNTVAIFGEDMMDDMLRYYGSAIGSKQAMKYLWLADMDGKFSIQDIELILDQVRKEVEPVVLVVDHLKLMKMPYGFTGVDALEALSVELKMLAKRENVILLTATQAGFGKDKKGMERLYGAKVGIGGNMDIVIMINDVYQDQYSLSLDKAKGRAMPLDKDKVVIVDWRNMEVKE